MTYRDELGQAHQRIDQLEGQLREARAPHVPAHAPRTRSAVAMLVIGTTTCLLSMCGGAAVFLARKKAMAPPRRMVSVDEVLRQPALFRSSELRVQGELVGGTLTKGGDPCELRFTIERNRLRLPVRATTCIAPDAFHDVDGLPIVVDGTLGDDLGFKADTILVPLPAIPTPRTN